MEKRSWLCTLVTQFSLCLALFLALNLGQPQKPINPISSQSRPIDLYFITVSGGFRPLNEQTLLLRQIEKVVKAYKARFVVNISELGEDDQLMLNAMWYFQSLKVPWYTTRALKGQGANYFLKQIEIPFGKTLDVIAVDTGSLLVCNGFLKLRNFIFLGFKILQQYFDVVKETILGLPF